MLPMNTKESEMNKTDTPIDTPKADESSVENEKTSLAEDQWREALNLVDEHEEEVHVDGKKERMKGVYLLPNLFTTAALFSGFYAIVSGFNGKFEHAAIAIFIAGIFDAADGRVARMMNAQSKFGAEYDSLSDMVSFGVAPAMVMFSFALSDLGKFGWMMAFIYVACAALRLARFNTMAETADNNFFTGLASPAAAALIAGTVWVCFDVGIVGSDLPYELAVFFGLVTGIAGMLMIVNVRYNSFKGIDFRSRVPFVFMILLVFIFGIVMLDPPRVLLAVAVLYALSGPVSAAMRKFRLS
jgi:CDP-diacylglycerol--serine O-phosphatidyltransferase